MAGQTPTQDQTPTESTPAVGPTSVEAAPKAGKVIRYIGTRADFSGMKGSHREITLTQFKEAGVEKPFNDKRTFVLWSPENGYAIDKDVFTEDALKILAAQEDLEEVTLEQ